jgi:hypothetical protein
MNESSRTILLAVLAALWVLASLFRRRTRGEDVFNYATALTVLLLAALGFLIGRSA